jgi:hypothetical protein
MMAEGTILDGTGVVLHPTHTCFDDAVENLIYLMERDGRHIVKDARIVHAVIAPDGEEMSHAWLEYRGEVYFTAVKDGRRVLVVAGIAEYEAKSKIKHVTKYTLWEAYEEEKRTGHYGPWDPQYRALCGNEVPAP